MLEVVIGLGILVGIAWTVWSLIWLTAWVWGDIDVDEYPWWLSILSIMPIFAAVLFLAYVIGSQVTGA